MCSNYRTYIRVVQSIAVCLSLGDICCAYNPDLKYNAQAWIGIKSFVRVTVLSHSQAILGVSLFLEMYILGCVKLWSVPQTTNCVKDSNIPAVKKSCPEMDCFQGYCQSCFTNVMKSVKNVFNFYSLFGFLIPFNHYNRNNTTFGKPISS